MSEPIIVREWSSATFHERVLDLEARGYVARLETYDITAEMNPETGEIIHLHTIEMLPSTENLAPDPTPREIDRLHAPKGRVDAVK